MTVKSAAQQLQLSLAAIYEPEEAKNIADLVMEKLTGMGRSERICYPGKLLSPPQEARYLEYREQLLVHRPVQYVLGETEFYGLTLMVDESVLIPRPETEELVDRCLKWLAKNNQVAKPLNILDIGTGSGCIALALKKHLPGATVLAADISVNALKTAERNAALNHLDIRLLQWNILAEAIPPALPRKIDLIISNPPYITVAEKSSMAARVLDFEPHQALFVTNQDPLQFYKSIEQLAGEILSPYGALFFELHEQFAPEARQYFADRGWQVKLTKDFQRKDRMLMVTSSSPSR
ncbi:MAG TPA: peptide chain release factor N(5)-glutamine methyltransferase [Edaphocola sp.]|nr:peptide chain release factor N(5)-glutamine methyltransferase [Edaphocola sp.]